MDEIETLVAINSYYPLGNTRVNLLLKYYSPQKIWSLSKQELIEVGLRESLIEGFMKYRSGFNKGEYFNQLKREGINYVTILNKEYPQNLKGIDDAPVVLYYKGTLFSSDSNSVAIVGTRKMTGYGKIMTERFTRDLVQSGVVIISGLARGVDTVAHISAIKNSGRTIAVLGSGLDMIYPPENSQLAQEIIKNGAIISEYPLGIPPRPENFVARNRIVSGLSKVVLVMEGAKKSGTLITASFAASQGKTVFALPGDVTSPLSEAPLYLINNGARVLTNINDVVEELGQT